MIHDIVLKNEINVGIFLCQCTWISITTFNLSENFFSFKEFIHSSLYQTVNVILKMEIFMNSKDDGFVYSWGLNYGGQLGHDDINESKIPTLIDGFNKIKKIYCGSNHTMAINGDNIFSKY